MKGVVGGKVVALNQHHHDLQSPTDLDVELCTCGAKRSIVGDADPVIVSTHHEAGSVFEGKASLFTCGFDELRECGLDDLKAETFAVGCIEPVDFFEHRACDVECAEMLTYERKDRQVRGLIINQNVRIE